MSSTSTEPILENEILHDQHFRMGRGQETKRRIYVDGCELSCMTCQRSCAGPYDDVTSDTEHISKPFHLLLATKPWLTRALSNVMQ